MPKRSNATARYSAENIAKKYASSGQKLNEKLKQKCTQNAMNKLPHLFRNTAISNVKAVMITTFSTIYSNSCRPL